MSENPWKVTADQVGRMVGMLVVPSAISVGMIVARFAYVADLRFRFCGLILNLLLAWIPMMLARLIWRTAPTKRLSLSLLFGAWLLFFPNAFYITTDLIH